MQPTKILSPEKHDWARGGYNCFSQSFNGFVDGKLAVLEKPEDHILIISSIFAYRETLMIFLKLLLHLQN